MTTQDLRGGAVAAAWFVVVLVLGVLVVASVVAIPLFIGSVVTVSVAAALLWGWLRLRNRKDGV